MRRVFHTIEDSSSVPVHITIDYTTYHAKVPQRERGRGVYE